MNKKNRFKSIVKTDRYGVTYVKNFILWADGGVSMQYWSSENTHIRHKRLS